jgi:DNA adenine methylase
MNGIPTFVKWAGGKKQLLEQFRLYFPNKINRYFESFAGGGAVAFYVIKHYKPKEVYLSDSNEELVNAYNTIKSNVEKLIKELKEYKKLHSKEFYLKVRAQDPKGLSDLEKAVRFIYLNKTCFNGLYRVNSKGEFNVPMGNYKNPAIVNEEDLREISRLLKNAKIETKDFTKIKTIVKKNDFVYFDPPYYPISKTSSFTTYTKEKFLDKEQKKLAELFKKLDKKGAKVMLSNSDSDFIKDLYQGYTINTVKASRMINCDAKGRGKINEVVITNYRVGEQEKL